MYHAFLKSGRVEAIECDPRDVESELDERQAILLFSADSPEEYQRTPAKDPNGKFCSY